jgi:hypothetical protein
VADDLRADLDQLLFEAGQRPILYRLGRRQRTQKVAEIIGERMKLKPSGVGNECTARQPRPSDRAVALLDPLFARPALVVEGDDILGWPLATIGAMNSPASCFRLRPSNRSANAKASARSSGAAGVRRSGASFMTSG